MKNFYPTLIAALLTAGSGFGQTAAVLSDRAAARFLDQATWGPTPASIAQLTQAGIDGWLTAQFALNTSDLPDQPVLTSAGKNNNNLRPVQEAFFQNALSGQDQLRQRVAFALSEIWVVSDLDIKYAYAFPPYWRVLRNNAFGNYRDLIKAMTLNPAMGHYLNMANSNKADPARGTAANENYGRELMQLFTLGLTQLNPDGSPVLNSAGNPVPTYGAPDVTAISMALTGWTYPTAPGASPHGNNAIYFVGQMFPVEANHDTSAKTLYGVTIPAGQTAAQDLESVLNILMQQKTMAPFVSQQLIQHLVTSNPSPAYVQRVSSVFLNDGTGTVGNMQATIAAILKDPEARAADDPNAAVNANFGHLREPVLFMTGVLRGLNGTLGASSAIDTQTSEMGQDLFNAPSVFSYFSPENAIGSTLRGPEFQIYSTQTVSDRGNIVNALIYGVLDKTTRVDLAAFTKYSGNIPGLVDYIGYAFLHRGMSPALKQAAMDAANAASTPAKAAQAALYIVLTSGEYQVIQ
jgi:uncharacterized protein (DUF1800 family)